MSPDSASATARRSSLADRLVPQVGEPVEEYAEPLTNEEEQAYRDELDALEPAHAAAAARLHTLFAG